MTMELAAKTLRTGLHTAQRAAWAVTEIFDGQPMLIPDETELPRGFCFLARIEPDYAGRSAGFGQVSLWHIFTVGLQRAWPAAGTIEAAKEADLQAFLSVITADKIFLRDGTNGYRKQIRDMRFTVSGETDVQQSYYQVEIDFAVEVVTSV